MSKNLSKAEAAILRAFQADPDRSIHYRELGKAAGLTLRGGRIVLNRMMDHSLLAQPDFHKGDYVLTFKGARALGLVGAEA